MATAIAVLALSGRVQAQPKTDVVTLANSDRITGEVKRLDRGRLEFNTDDVGTIYLEWDKITSLAATRQFEVGTTDGRRFLGSLDAGAPRSLMVIELAGPVSLQTAEVTFIAPIGESFWKKLDGTIDVGFSYTRSSQIAQLNGNASTLFRKPAFEARLAASGTLTENRDDGDRDDRGILQASYLRYRGQRWFVAGAAGFENNESLGIRLRSQIAGAVGLRPVNSNRAQLLVGAGLSLNDERGVDTEPTQNVEALFLFRTSYYSYDRPKTNVDVSFQHYPSLSNAGRQRIQLDASVKREVWKDVFFAVNLFDTFDSRPPNPDADTNDVGIVLSFGVSY